MRAVSIREPGGPEVLEVVELPCPQPAADEVLIKVAAAGVNRPDCLQRRGLYPPPPGASPLPGLEAAGVVIATGTGVKDLQPGDHVCALLAGGGYAEYCTVPAVQCLPVPAGMTLQAAAALPETFFTVWTNVFELGRLQPGERLLVHGGASGIGTTAIQLANELGAEVYATAGSAAKTELCKRLGARHAVDYHDADFVTELKPLTANQGMDVILDIVGGSYLEQNIRLLAHNGRLVVIGILGGAKGTLNLGLVLAKRLTVTGSTLRARSPAEKGEIAYALRERVWPLLAAGKVKPVVQEYLPLEDTGRAHALLEASSVAGKLVLIVDPALADNIVPD
jgi:putative PIG3 family NAD(P)H quinone oxidoreductase